MRDEVEFLPADKHKRFPQTFFVVHSITFRLHMQACPKYPKQQMYNIFGKYFFACRLTSKVSSNWCYHSRSVWAGMSNLTQNNKFAISVQYLKKEVSDDVDNLQVSMKACYKLILWFWWGWSSISKVRKIASLQCIYNISKKS